MTSEPKTKANIGSSLSVHNITQVLGVDSKPSLPSEHLLFESFPPNFSDLVIVFPGGSVIMLTTQNSIKLAIFGSKSVGKTGNVLI